MAAIRGRSAGSASRTITDSMMMAPMIVPDTKDWTWVLDEVCPDCTYAARDVDPARIGAVIRDNAQGWLVVLAQPGARERPARATWPPLESPCHVRDVNLKFAERLTL